MHLVKFFRQARSISVEVLYLTVAVLVGIAVLGYITKTSGFNSLKGIPGVGAVAGFGQSLLDQTYNA